jgi:asparagine synthase (glutamine-hydrolysing)
MAGLCGVVGGGDGIDDVAAGLEWTGEETTTLFRDGTLAVAGSFPIFEEADQPVQVGDDALLWVWGSVLGFEDEDGYRPRDVTAESVVAYCGDLYEKYGLEFVSGLNGDFVGVLYDRRAGSVSIFTDRFGLRDTYYVKPTAETLVFSTAIQSLSGYPDVTPAFDSELVAEYLACDFRTFGLKTPLEGTFLFPPGAVTTVDPASLSMSARQYWTPTYRPRERSFSSFLDEFSSLFETVVAERLQSNREYGLLLSGGADSRLVLAAADSDQRRNLTAYHCTGWMNREARAAEQVALTAGVDFEWIQRGPDYHERALSHNPGLSNFVGTFEQAHAEGFIDRISDDVDAMVTASFADSNFKAHSFPQSSLDLGPLGTVHLPKLGPMDRIEHFVDYWVDDPPRYLSTSVDPEAVLRSEIRETDAGIEHHGLTYGSPEELFVCGTLTPRTNGSVLFLLQSLRQHLPAWSPFVDNRLVDLYLSTPKRHFVRHNVIARAVERLDPALGAVTYANTGLALSAPFWAHWIGEHCLGFADQHLSITDPPAPHLSNGPWPHNPRMIREQSFVRESIEANEDLIRELPFLDWEGVRECYRAHMAGERNDDELYGLVTLLEMPVTRRIVENA